MGEKTDRCACDNILLACMVEDLEGVSDHTLEDWMWCSSGLVTVVMMVALGRDGQVCTGL